MARNAFGRCGVGGVASIAAAAGEVLAEGMLVPVQGIGGETRQARPSPPAAACSLHARLN